MLECYITGRARSNKGICREFCDYFQKLLLRDLGLSSDQFNAYLVDFSLLVTMEAAKCDGHKV